MIYEAEVKLKKQFRDRHGEHLKGDIEDIGLKNIPVIRYSQIYRISGGVLDEEVKLIASKLLADNVTETFVISKIDPDENSAKLKSKKTDDRSIEVWLKSGVTDTVAESVAKAVRDLGVVKDFQVKTGHKFSFSGDISSSTLKKIAERLLVNPMIQDYKI